MTKSNKRYDTIVLPKVHPIKRRKEKPFSHICTEGFIAKTSVARPMDILILE